MSDRSTVIADDDAALAIPFVREMVRQVRALDTYGTYESLSDAAVLDALVLTPERKRTLPVVGDPDEEVVARVEAFYNAVAVQVEAGCGLMAVPLVKLSHEGFGRALVSVGRLVVVDRRLRDVHRFGFASLDKLAREGTRLVDAALALVEAHRGAAEL